MALTLASMKPLLEQFKGAGLMVSCYADLSPGRVFAGRWPGPFRERVAAIKEMLADDKRAWQKFERNF